MDELENWKRRLCRPASLMHLHPLEGTEPITASFFGRIAAGRTGEEWPRFDRKPMWPLCQINCSDLPVRPEALADIAMLRIFIAEEFWEADLVAGDGWCVRADTALDGLGPTAAPDHGSKIVECSVSWEHVREDFPSSDDVPREVIECAGGIERYLELFPNLRRSKVGGWPTTIQSEIYWAPWNKHPADPEYVLQIDSEPDAGWMWGDSGTGYFGRGTGASRDRWAMEWQCY